MKSHKSLPKKAVRSLLAQREAHAVRIACAQAREQLARRIEGMLDDLLREQRALARADECRELLEFIDVLRPAIHAVVCTALAREAIDPTPHIAAR